MVPVQTGRAMARLYPAGAPFTPRRAPVRRRSVAPPRPPCRAAASRRGQCPLGVAQRLLGGGRPRRRPPRGRRRLAACFSVAASMASSRRCRRAASRASVTAGRPAARATAPACAVGARAGPPARARRRGPPGPSRRSRGRRRAAGPPPGRCSATSDRRPAQLTRARLPAGAPEDLGGEGDELGAAVAHRPQRLADVGAVPALDRRRLRVAHVRSGAGERLDRRRLLHGHDVQRPVVPTGPAQGGDGGGLVAPLLLAQRLRQVVARGDELGRWGGEQLAEGGLVHDAITPAAAGRRRRAGSARWSRGGTR